MNNAMRKIQQIAQNSLVDPHGGQMPSKVKWQGFLARVAVNTWALRRKTMQMPESAESNALKVHVDAVHGALQEIGVEIQEYSSQPYYPGLSVEILAFQPSPGIERDTITSTIRPAILLDGQIIQRGQVIVATPERKNRR
jgi:hypothetical protein